jgi:UPF0271 protein
VGAAVRYVKPHGALYNAVVRHEAQAAAVIDAVARYDADLAVLGLPGSALLRIAAARGLRAVAEAFADRAYAPDATLVPRREPGAVLSDPDQIAARCVGMVLDGEVVAVDGTVLAVRPESLCVHGDSPGAVGLAQAVCAALARAGIALAPFAAG